MSDVEELERALDAPWEQWAVFLHPAQRDIVEREYNGPARVAGTAGTGKTIVALHRAVRLALVAEVQRKLESSQVRADTLDARDKILRRIERHWTYRLCRGLRAPFR